MAKIKKFNALEPAEKLLEVFDQLPGKYVYIAYADAVDGTGYSEVFGSTKDYVAILVSAMEIPVRTAETYTGLWKKYTGGEDSNFRIMTDYYVETFDTKFKGNQVLPFNFQTMGGQAWYHEGTYRRVYFCFMGRLNWNSPEEYITNYISYYDIDTCEFADPVDLGVDYADICDVHIMAFPVVTDDGYIVVLHEKGDTGQGWDGNAGHETPIVHKISDSPEDISSFTRVGEITPGKTAYPHVWKFTNGNIYVMYRLAVASDHSYTAIQYSDNDGGSFKSMAGVANTTTNVYKLTNGNGYAYFLQLSGPKEHGINIVGMDYDLADGGSTDNLYFLHSDDGITWENINSWKETGSGQFSKNVVSSGYITQAELDANFKLCDTVADPTNTKWNIRIGTISAAGTPIIQYALENFTTTNRIDDVFISYWSGSAWVQVSVKEAIWQNEILCRSAGSVAKGHAIIPYTESKWDFIVSYIPDGLGLPINDNWVMDAGNMTGDKEPVVGSCTTAQSYIVVATDGTKGIPATYVVGDIFPCTDDGVLDSDNKVKQIRLGVKVMRTFDKGVTWQCVKEIKSDTMFGLTRVGTNNINFLDYDKLFVFIGDSVTTDQVYPDATNIKMLYKNLLARNLM